MKSFRGNAFQKAIPTLVGDVKCRSKLEARVYSRLLLECRTNGAKLFREPRFPLFNLAPDEYGKPMYFNPDFLIVHPDGKIQVIDAKSKTLRSRDWLRGKRAFEGLYEIVVEETDR